MSLLVDNQLPVALARHLAANGWACAHVLDVGLDNADDRVIWGGFKHQVQILHEPQMA